jgi:murein DD-endopeptidase MepM/ murein hydrolase activator NlpD
MSRLSNSGRPRTPAKHKLKARDKVTQKISRDGLVECNAETGEAVRVSKRETSLDLRGGKSEHEPSHECVLQRATRSDGKPRHKKNKAQYRQSAEQKENPVSAADNKAATDVVVETQKQMGTSEPQEIQSEKPISRPDITSNEPHRPAPRVPQSPIAKSKPPPVVTDFNTVRQIADDKISQAAAQSKSLLNHDDNSPLQFEQSGEPPKADNHSSKQKRRYYHEQTKSVDTASGNVVGDTPCKLQSAVDTPVVTTETPISPLMHGKTSELRFENSNQAEVIADNPQQPKSSKQRQPDISAEPKETAKVGTADTSANPGKPAKLQFTQYEAAPPVPSRSEVKQQQKLGKSQEQADKSVKKLEKAQAKLPSKKKFRSKRVFNEETGKANRKLYFETEVKSQSQHLKGALPLRPVKLAGNTALAFGHRKMFQVERENVATEAARKGEMFAEGAVRSALRHNKLAPYRKVQKLERKATKKSINAAYQKTLADNLPDGLRPKLQSNVFSRMAQKRKIKKDYAKAARQAKKTAQTAQKAGATTAKATKRVVGAIARHPGVAIAVTAVVLLAFIMMSLIGLFGSAGSGGLSGIIASSYLADDADIDNAELYYTEWETDLQEQINNAESSYGGYDEYRYSVGDISHNPYELMAYLTVKYQNFSYAAITADLQALFNEQYQLSFTPSTETRYADPNDSNDDGDYEPYDWNVLTITLTAKNFSDIAASHLSTDEAEHYAILMQTKGARQYLENPFGEMNWLPYITSYYGYRVHPISGEKNYHKGVDIGLPTGTPIQSGQDGTVTFAGYSGDYGNYVIITGADGLVSKYAHCDSVLAANGQTVKAGDVIATVGNTGSSTGSHLHLEVLKNGQYLNPLFFADCGSYDYTPTYGEPGTPMGDGSYAALIAEAELHLGKPYIFGANGPNAFDCSSFVSWILTHSGVKNTGRLTAYGLYQLCTPVSPSEAKPGDLIFFERTYSTTSPTSHVGLYVGTDSTGRPRMLHAGSPIQYTYIDTVYWQSHFYSFGRIAN